MDMLTVTKKALAVCAAIVCVSTATIAVALSVVALYLRDLQESLERSAGNESTSVDFSDLTTAEVAKSSLHLDKWPIIRDRQRTVVSEDTTSAE